MKRVYAEFVRKYGLLLIAVGICIGFFLVLVLDHNNAVKKGLSTVIENVADLFTPKEAGGRASNPNQRAESVLKQHLSNEKEDCKLLLDRDGDGSIDSDYFYCLERTHCPGKDCESALGFRILICGLRPECRTRSSRRAASKRTWLKGFRTYEVFCDNMVDDDGDMRIDCDDQDCILNPICGYTF